MSLEGKTESLLSQIKLSFRTKDTKNLTSLLLIIGEHLSG